MGAADPTYPLYPIACILAAIGLLLVLLTSVIRQNWNLGVTFLCFWLFLENLVNGANAIIWSDNADIKYYVYCDVASHLLMLAYIVKPMATLIITRRLYLIANLQSAELPARRWNPVFEWTLGLVVPLLVAGPIYYVHQGYRFEIDEVFGCTDTVQISILELLTIDSWTIVPPLISVIFFYPKVVCTFYRQSRAIHSFLDSNSTSVSRTNYLRILALASVDIVLTLPIGIVTIVLDVISTFAELGFLPFYWGWTTLHTDWEPVSVPYTEIRSFGTANIVQTYFIRWIVPVLAYFIFGLFGLTSEARASYWRIICNVGGWIGWKPVPRREKGNTSLGEIEFGAGPQQSVSLGEVEMGPGSCRLSFVAPEAPTTNQSAEHVLGESDSASKWI